MAKKASFEIYEGLDERKKTFAVVPVNYTAKEIDTAVKYLKKLNHCSSYHIYVKCGYVWEDNLYFEDPEIPGAKEVAVLFYVR